MFKFGVCSTLVACSLGLASAANAQTYVGEATFSEYDETLTGYYYDPDVGAQIEVTCTWRRSISWTDVVVTLQPVTFSFNVDSSSIALSGDPRFCVDGSNSFPFSLRTVNVSSAGVTGQNSTGSVTANLSFDSAGASLSGPVTYGGASGQADLALIGPEQLLSDLIEQVLALNIKAGIGNALDHKLQNALDALDRAQAGHTASAVGILYAFIQSVEAQRGKTLNDTQADDLVASAQAIIDALS